MKRLLLSLAALVLLLGSAEAQTVKPGQYMVTPNTYVDTEKVSILTDVNGRIVTTAGVATGASAQQVQGNAATLATDVGNPVKMGCVFLTTAPGPTTGQRVDCQAGPSGEQVANARGLAVTQADGLTNAPALEQSVSSVGALATMASRNYPLKFNGSTWDRDFTCPSSVAVSVTAAATTQLVALVSAQQVRVCSFVLTESLAGTAKFVYGTGSNCGTGTTDITAAMALGTSASIALSAASGSLFRTIAANALCLTAVTGNITGFITYAQF